MTLDIPDLPSGWVFTTLSFHDSYWENRPADWHVRATNGEDITDAWGNSISDAFDNLVQKILDEDFWELSYKPVERKLSIDLAAIGLAKPVVIKRRKGL